MNVTRHAIERYRERIGTERQFYTEVRQQIVDDVLAGEVATRSVLRKTFSPTKLRLGDDALFVFNAERRAVFVLEHLPQGGLIVTTVLKAGAKRSGKKTRFKLDNRRKRE